MIRSIDRADSPIPGRGKRPTPGSHAHHGPAPLICRFSRPLVGNFEESILNNRLKPVRTVDGYIAELRASCKQHQPKPLRSGVCMSFFSTGDSFPYLGRVPLGSRGYRIPKKGTIQVTLFNPHGTLVKLFLLLYNLSDMPANSQTFLRQKTLFLPKTTKGHDEAELTTSQLNENDPTSNSNQSSEQRQQQQLQPKASLSTKRRVKYLIQLNIVSSKSGQIYLNRDVRIFISKKTDLETASQLANQDYEVKAFDEMPSNPRYSIR